MIKVSFDFDSTLSINTIENYAKELIDRNVDVYITTSRIDDDMVEKKGWDVKKYNADLYEVATRLNISRDKIHFTNHEPKFNYIDQHDFKFHLDDDYFELLDINQYTKTVGISCFGNNNWRKKCEKVLYKFLK